MRSVVPCACERLAPGRHVAADGLRVAGVRRQQRAHLRQQRVVAGAGFEQSRLAFPAGEVGDLVEDRERAPAPFARGVVHAGISASRKARALRQSRRRVRSLISSICAISASE